MRARRRPGVRAPRRSSRPLLAPVSQMRHINLSLASPARAWERASSHVSRGRRRGLRRLFIGIPYDPRMTRGISQRPPATAGVLAIDPEVARRCDELHERLNAVARARTP
jgi:hypothetical protein